MSTCVEPTTYEVALGDGLTLLFPLLVDDVAAAIAGWQPTLVVTTDLDDTTVEPLCTLNLADGISAYNTTKWLVEALAATHFADAVAGHYHYAMRAIDPEGQPRTLETGYIKFTGAGPAPA